MLHWGALLRGIAPQGDSPSPSLKKNTPLSLSSLTRALRSTQKGASVMALDVPSTKPWMLAAAIGARFSYSHVVTSRFWSFAPHGTHANCLPDGSAAVFLCGRCVRVLAPPPLHPIISATKRCCLDGTLLHRPGVFIVFIVFMVL